MGRNNYISLQEIYINDVKRYVTRQIASPPFHCSITQRRLNLRPDFKGDTFPDSRWSWRPPITLVSKPGRVTYRAQNRNATFACVKIRAIQSGIRGDNAFT